MTKYEQRVLLGMIKDCYEPSSLVAAHLNYLADAIDARAPEVRTRMVGVCIDYLGRATEKDWTPRG